MIPSRRCVGISSIPNKMTAYYANHAEFDSGRGLNSFMDSFASLELEFYDSPNYSFVLQTVKKHLLTNVTPNLDDVNHPFNKYADETLCTNALITKLCSDIMSMFQEPRYREIVLSFFHGGGAHREQIDELMDAYWVYVDEVLNIV